MTSLSAPAPLDTATSPAGRTRSSVARAGLWLACLAVVVLACVAVWMATQQPWLGLTLVPEQATERQAAQVAAANQPEAKNVSRQGAAVSPASPLPGAEPTPAALPVLPGVMVQSVSPTGPSAAISPNVRLLSVASAKGGSLTLLATDLMEEPDAFNTYSEWADFYARQAQLAAWLRAGPLVLSLQDARGNSSEVRIQPLASRSVSSLPLVFWFQLFVGSFAALVGAWIFSLRPADRAARCLALTGAALLYTTFAAAVYSTRELAMPQELFRLLSSINHLGAVVFGIGLVGIFVFHPQTILRLRWFLLLALAYLAWGVADIFWWLESPDVAFRLLVLSQMLLAVALGIWQWRRAQGRPVDRAALRWVLLSFLVGAGAFIALMVCTAMLGWLPPVQQGYAFGLFLTMYIGLALGVKRHRVFDLDAWSLRALMWLFGMLGIVSVDALLISQLRWNSELSLVVSMVVCAALYFPLRQWIWEKCFGRAELGINDLTGDILGLGLVANELRTQRWTALLGRLFDADHIEQAGWHLPAASAGPARLLEQGMGLHVPSVAGMPALQLWQRDKGKRLFSSQDQRLASRLHALVLTVLQTRDAYNQGVAEDRSRIASDLHDDLGAHLLSIVQASSQDAAGASIATTARRALDDLRLSVRGLTSDALPATEVFADWRAETLARLELAHIETSWQHDEPDPSPCLSARTHVQLTRVLREVVSNVIRHSGARRCAITVALANGEITLTVADDGCGLALNGAAESGLSGGHGLANIERRARALGGWHHFGASSWAGAQVRVGVPLAIADV